MRVRDFFMKGKNPNKNPRRSWFHEIAGFISTNYHLPNFIEFESSRIAIRIFK